LSLIVIVSKQGSNQGKTFEVSKCGAENPDNHKFYSECGHGLLVKTTEAERRSLTVMFCDLPGSTAMSKRLDPEDLQNLVKAYQQC